MKLKPIRLTESMTPEEMDSAESHNDAVDAIRRGWTLKQHLACYKPQYRAKNEEAYRRLKS